MRKLLYGTLTLFLLMTLSGLPAYGYGGGGGGGGGGSGSGDGSGADANMTDLANGETSNPPVGFTPLPLDENYITELSPEQTASTDRTAITGEPETLSPEELQQLQAAFDFIMITTGGIILGYSTAAAGWTVLGQATASGAYAGLTTYATSDDDKAAGNTTKATIQDFIIGFIPVNPIGQAAISQGVNKLREVLPEPSFNRDRASLATLQRSFDPHYAW